MLRIFGLGKNRCKECGAELSDMEDLRDRVDDLMRNSAYAAEPLEEICARCRVSLAKGAPSLQANLHVIEARRVEKEQTASAAVPTGNDHAEQSSFQDATTDNKLVEEDYVSGGGYKTGEELNQERIDEYQQSRATETKGSLTGLLDWLVNAKTGRNVAGILLLLSIFLFNRLDEDDAVNTPADSEIPYATEQQPLAPSPSSEEVSTPPPTQADANPAPVVVPASNPGTWVTTNDYPLRALRQEREGTTAFRLEVGIDGRPTGCTVTSSSGHNDLDVATCSALMRRAKFSPITDGGGPASWSSRVRWVIP